MVVYRVYSFKNAKFLRKKVSKCYTKDETAVSHESKNTATVLERVFRGSLFVFVLSLPLLKKPSPKWQPKQHRVCSKRLWNVSAERQTLSPNITTNMPTPYCFGVDRGVLPLSASD